MEDLREGGFLVSKIHQIMGRIFAKLLKEFKIEEINTAQGRVMFPLWRQDNLSFKELLKRTQLSKATLSKMLNNLEKSGYIERVPPKEKEDQRTIFIKLTKKSIDLQVKYIDVSKEMTKIFYNEFSDIELDEFENYLRRILENLIQFNEGPKI